MDTLPASQVVMPFGKINIWNQPDGSKKIRAYIVIERPFEGAKTGLALDGSVSLRPAYGYPNNIWSLFFPSKSLPNEVTGQAQKICSYLAKHVDVDSNTTAIYWATGSPGGLETIGDLSDAQAMAKAFDGPKSFGSQTKLAPALKYFTDRYKTAKWGMFVFVTDGILDDLADVKSLTTQLARDIASGKRNPIKLILFGVGSQIQESQMIELDDLDTGVKVDLWDHKIAAEMSDLSEMFTEVVDETVILADNGIVRDSIGRVIKDFRDTGLPALLEFTLPKDACKAFNLEFGGQIIRQPLS